MCRYASGRLRLRAAAAAIVRWREAVELHKEKRALLKGAVQLFVVGSCTAVESSRPIA